MTGWPLAITIILLAGILLALVRELREPLVPQSREVMVETLARRFTAEGAHPDDAVTLAVAAVDELEREPA